ncbi:MFS transporter [Burkholderia sp. L27(2015)]|uniref:MFS transporter n=1 Tax=Burkholderia sp. L27(2015) TaxID=1641858 RepID=UPI00131CBFCD|nr:MFS transporter [Burkholderia sp. L27(2015)]
MDTEFSGKQPNVASRLERLPLSRYQHVIFLIIATAFLFDTMDTAALAYMLGTIKADLGITTAQTGLLASASLLGMLVGAAAAGILSDKYGRKPIFQFSMVLWGAGSLFCGLSNTYLSLMASRVLLGVGMGMELPIALTLVAEFLPTRLRGRYTAVLEGFLPIGFIAVGLLVYFLMPVLGWRGIFIVMAIPALFLLVIRRVVPESPRWLEATGKYGTAETTMAAIENHVMRALRIKTLAAPVEGVITIGADVEAGWLASVKDLWLPECRTRTVMLWIVWFFTLLGFYGLTSWLAALLQQAGYAVTKSILYTVVMSCAGIPGFMCAAWSLERWGRKPAAVFFLLGSAVFAFIYGQCAGHHLAVAELIVSGLLLQFFLFGMWCVIYAYTPELYPTRSRTTGSGMASAIGRIGSMIGPFGIGLILPAMGQDGAFGIGAVCFLISAISIVLLGVETKGVPLT